MNTTVEVEITHEVETSEAFGAPILRFFRRLLVLAHREATQPGVVPIDTGQLRQTMAPGGGVTEAGGSFEEGFYAQVGSGLRRGGILAASDRHHYAAGPSAGQPTKGWLDRSIPSVMAGVPALEQQLAADIAAATGGNGG